MKIQLVTSDFPPFISGIGDYTKALARALSRAGADGVRVTTSCDATEPPLEDLGDGASVSREVYAWNGPGMMEIVERATDYHVTHLQYPGVRWGRSLAVLRLLGLIRRLPWVSGGCATVVTFHEFRSMRKRWRLRASLAMGGADAVVCVDADDVSFAKRWNWLPRVLGLRQPPSFHVIPIASNAEPVAASTSDRRRWRDELGLSDDELGVVFFGILYPHKGLDEMLRAIDMVRGEGLELRPIVIGDFDRDDDWTCATQQRLGRGDIIWQRGVSLERVSEVLHASDLAALPFHSGSGPNRSSLLACLAHGLPTITTDGPCTPTSFKRECPLAYVPVNDAKAIADQLRRLADDGDLRATMRAEALAFADKRTWAAVAEAHLKLYRSLSSQMATKPKPKAVAV